MIHRAVIGILAALSAVALFSCSSKPSGSASTTQSPMPSTQQPSPTPSTVGDWFPVHAGDKWIYEHETRDDTGGGESHLEIHTWTTEETTTASWTVPEGTLIGRKVQIIKGSRPEGWRVLDANQAYLIRGDCLYDLGAGDWEPSTRQLSSDFLKWLGDGEISADFCFPLVVHRTWGAPNWGGSRPASEAKDWEVEGIDIRNPSAPDKQNTFHVKSIPPYLGSGQTADIWFEKGVGIVREEEIHHGTTDEERTRLLHFESASQR
jgi:hypothetical protein